MLNPHRSSQAPAQRGFTIVEMMVGITVGLFVVGGSLNLFTRNVVSSRQLMLETRLNQDLRAAADLLTRELRRAGFWGNAIQGTIATGTGSVTTANPYSSLNNVSSAEVNYGFSRDSVENNLLDSSEQFGFRVNAGALQMQTSSGSWVDVTDTNTLSLQSITLTPTSTTLPIGNLCYKTCAAGTPNCPTVTVRSYAIVLNGSAASDTNLKRSFKTSVRLRNEQLAGACPVS
jgi:prepilin peptidase dependent protein B